MKSPGSWFLSVLAAVLIPAAAAAGVSVEGRALAPDGRGLAGARVELWAVLRIHEQGLRELGAREEARPAARSATDAEGWYRLEAPREGMWRVAIAARGLVPLETVPMALVEDCSLQAAPMKADAGLLVRVEGADGKPVAGARVAAETGSRSPWTPGWQPVRRIGVSGADGTVRLPRSADETLEVGAVAPGHAPGRVAETDRGSLALRLQPGRRWQLEVRDPAGPVADAVVRDAASRLPLGRTDSEGRLSVVAPASGPWVLRVDTRDGRMVPFQTAAKEGAEPGAPVTRRLHLPPLVQLTGRTVDRIDGRPLPGTLVWPAGDPAAFVRADGAGRYRLPWTSPVQTWIQAGRSGYFYAQESYVPSEKTPPDAPVLALHPAGSLAGTTVDERGQPVPSAEVRVFPAGDPKTVIATVRSSAEGKFRVPNLRRDESYELLALRPGLAPARETVTLDGGREDPSGVRLVLGRGRTALGRVVDEDGEPVAGAEATLVRSLGAEVRAEGSLNVAVDDGLYRAETDGDGRFEIARLPAGWFDLEVRRPGLLPLVRPGVELGEETEADLGTLTLRRGVALEGRVVDPLGRPVPEAEVRVMPDILDGDRAWESFHRSGPAAVTGTDGRFRLEGLDHTVGLVLEVRRPGHLTSRVAVERLDQPVVVTLEPGSEEEPEPVRERTEPDGEPEPEEWIELRGRVVGPEGEPVGGALVEAVHDIFSRQPVYSAGDGSFVLEVRKTDGFELLARKPGYSPGTLDERSAAGARDGLEIRLRRTSALSGRILGIAPEDLPRVRVEAIGRSYRQPGIVTPEGTYRILELSPGEWEVVAELGSRSVRVVVVIRPDGEPAALDLAIPP